MDRPGRGLAGSGDRWSGSWDRSCWRNEVQARVSGHTWRKDSWILVWKGWAWRWLT